MSFSSDSANAPKVQFRTGFPNSHRVGKYKAPATAQDEGTIVKLNSAGTDFEVAADNDGEFILEQPCALVSPTGNAANREKYTQGFVQRAVECATAITAYMMKDGIIWTKKLVTGTATGAISASTTVGTEVDDYGGAFREHQAGKTARGKVIENDFTDNEAVVIKLY
jgi:hypothetical protein